MARRKNKQRAPKTANVGIRPSNKINRMLLLIGVPIVLLLALLAIAAHNAKSEPRPHARTHARRAPEPTAPPEPTSVETMIEANAAMNRDFEEWFAIAAEIAGDHPQARTLIEFAHTHAVPSALLPGGMTRFLITDGDWQGAMGRLSLPNPTLVNPRSFEITVADRALRRSYGMPAISDWEYSGDRNELFVPPRSGYSRTYGAIVFLHELQHAYDLCTGAEPDPPSPRDWAEGEARAYNIELTVLDRVTNGASTRFARSLVDRYRAPGDTRWIWMDSTSDIYPSFQEWDPIIGEPQVSAGEGATRNGTLLILMNRELIAREGMGNEAFLEFINATRSHT